MKILCISGSPRGENSDTFRLAKETVAGITTAEPGVSVEYIHLGRLRIEFCTGCSACHRKLLFCPLKDDIAPVLRSMREAEAIIFASPVYINHVTAQLKALLDRSSPFIHCQMLTGKYGAALAASGGGPHAMVLDYLKEYLVSCGVQYVGGVSGPMSRFNAMKEEAKTLGVDLAKAVKENIAYPNQLSTIEKQREFFKGVISSRKEEWKDEYEYWKEKGWI
ncbi:flavodoxin family protein [Aminivibrio sp.]|jgi:multimeric flavodoxin WrbA|uniref:flavodoxin family protein n=1 Tax=Aminivibrio sp. TaxID=1872489 RepID=UPI001A4F8E62|nr:flavodoxin family protein [Aminivibrio sp.]MBL3538648.1 flavodoxin family protein [Aminivibrio sp.]